MNVGKKNRKKPGRVPKKRIERNRNCSGKLLTLDEDHNLDIDVLIHTEEETNFVCTGTGDHIKQKKKTNKQILHTNKRI